MTEMVNNKRNSAISSVKNLLAKIPEYIAKVSLEEDRYEYRIGVKPSSEDCCPFLMAFSTYDTYGLYFGHGLAFDDLPLSEFPPDVVAISILQGEVRESVRTLFGKTIMTSGVIALPGGRHLTDKAFLTPLCLLKVFGVGSVKDIVYSAYQSV